MTCVILAVADIQFHATLQWHGKLSRWEFASVAYLASMLEAAAHSWIGNAVCICRQQPAHQSSSIGSVTVAAQAHPCYPTLLRMVNSHLHMLERAQLNTLSLLKDFVHSSDCVIADVVVTIIGNPE